MLTALYLGSTKWEAFSPLDSSQQFEASPFKTLGRERMGLLCQARLFAALAQQRRDEPFADQLTLAMQTNMKRYYEYHVARCLSSPSCVR